MPSEHDRPAIRVSPWHKDKDATRLVIGIFFVTVISALIVFLTVVQIPEDNKGTILLLMGSLSTAASYAISNMAGEPNGEKEKLQQALNNERKLREALQQQHEILEAKFKVLQAEFDKLQARLIERIAFVGEIKK